MILHKKKKLPPEQVSTIIEIAGLPGTGKTEIATLLGNVFGFPVLELPSFNPASFTGRALLATLKDLDKVTQTKVGTRWWALQSVANFLENESFLVQSSPVIVVNYFFSFKALFKEDSTGLFKHLPPPSKCYYLGHQFPSENFYRNTLPKELKQEFHDSFIYNTDKRIKRIKPKQVRIKNNYYKKDILEEISSDLIKTYSYTMIRKLEDVL